MEGNRKFTERQQALIDGVEFGMDHNLELDPEDVAEYHRLTGSSSAYIENMGKYRKYLIKYARKAGITPREANRHLLCRKTAVSCYGLFEKDLKWFDRDLPDGLKTYRDYPIGSKVRLVEDYPSEEPREVAGYRNISGYEYLVFTDGYMALAERVVN